MKSPLRELGVASPCSLYSQAICPSPLSFSTSSAGDVAAVARHPPSLAGGSVALGQKGNLVYFTLFFSALFASFSHQAGWIPKIFHLRWVYHFFTLHITFSDGSKWVWGRLTDCFWIQPSLTFYSPTTGGTEGCPGVLSRGTFVWLLMSKYL